MLKSRSNLKILLAVVTGVLAINVSMPDSTDISLTSAAFANNGGGGIDALMDRMRRNKRHSNSHRGFKRKAVKRKIRRGRKMRKSRRKIKRQRNRNLSANYLREGKKKSPEFWYVLDAGTPFETEERAMMRTMREALRNAPQPALSSEHRAELVRNMKASLRGAMPVRTPAPVAVQLRAPAPQPFVWPVPSNEVNWGRSTNPETQITTTVVGMADGNRAVTLTNAAGQIVNRFIVQR